MTGRRRRLGRAPLPTPPPHPRFASLAVGRRPNPLPASGERRRRASYWGDLHAPRVRGSDFAGQTLRSLRMSVALVSILGPGSGRPRRRDRRRVVRFRHQPARHDLRVPRLGRRVHRRSAICRTRSCRRRSRPGSSACPNSTARRFASCPTHSTRTRRRSPASPIASPSAAATSSASSPGSPTSSRRRRRTSSGSRRASCRRKRAGCTSRASPSPSRRSAATSASRR